MEIGGITLSGFLEVGVTIWKLVRPDSGLAIVAIRGSAIIKPPGAIIAAEQRAG